MVSVVIPSHNHAHYLVRAIDSVLSQTFKNWEIIVVDDGSTDDTRGVVAQFSDSRIHYVYQQNQGLSAARNTGIQQANGAYLAFLDADDEWEPEFLNHCIQLLEADGGLGFVYVRNWFIDSGSVRLPMVGGQSLRSDVFRSRILEGGFFPVHAALVRRQVIEVVGDFDTALKSLEDWDLWLRVSAVFPVCGIDSPLARYRVYPGSMSTHARRMHVNRMAVLAKHFGTDDGSPADWSLEKRRGYAFAYRTAALGYMAQKEPEEGWRYLQHAIKIYPDLLRRLDTFYELACGDQPRGYRGQAEKLDIERNGAELLNRLASLLDQAPRPVRILGGEAYGNAYLALAMLSDQAGRWSAARGYLFRAMRSNPKIWTETAVLRRFGKLLVGKRIVKLLRRYRSSKSG